MLIKHYLHLIRVHHYIKNILIFIPLFLSKNQYSLFNLQFFILIFITFCLVCSINYIINDYIDLKQDQLHPLKKNRSLASGSIKTKNAIFIAVLLFSIVLFLNTFFQLNCMAFFIGYLFFAQLYSLWLKHILILDIAFVTLFYVYRIILGTLLIDNGFSFWLLSFSFFFFFSLATSKRIVEISMSAKDSYKLYASNDLNFLSITGIISFFSSIIIFLLYINSSRISSQFDHPYFFLVICFLIFIWGLQFWHRLFQDHCSIDPLLYIVKSKHTYIYLFFAFICVILA
ncbi:hypothetical protein DID74_01560 [Candidatus Marinamargulisbacteria bacterium SCGC AG-333-B06]|nr:hypothetical protein DID74_01560 [Candidatus Marinamargulisbacteria bacterium SCGC AG-333-B06]